MSSISLIGLRAFERALSFTSELAGRQRVDCPIPVDCADVRDATPSMSRSIPARAIAALAADLARFSRTEGLASAFDRAAGAGGQSYPRALRQALAGNAPRWRAELEDPLQARLRIDWTHGSASLSLELLAELTDLQQAWLHGHSRRVASAAQLAAAAIGLGMASQQCCYRAGLVHGIGRSAIDGNLWNILGALPVSVREQMRLAPYWSVRALREASFLESEAEVASYVGERLDGAGDYRGCTGAAIPIEGQVLAAAGAWVALQSARPWRGAYCAEQAGAILAHEAGAGRFRADVVDALRGAREESAINTAVSGGLSVRETQVLRAISEGLTNKEVARQLAISPRTVGTHVESIFRKLHCTTRAQASQRALTLRII
ncbi:HD domain-containing phosphohydrolase [Burkholderia gladioli]|uniref:HD domain-containing phosphohydrolase n=1 Tax=Burkholderia gladioli TaxID=28095 RepID=UPI0016402878|nr:HD domain-containing phosphohydrolase [Burkholderia gladioli]